MRIYLIIVGIAITLVTALLLSARFWVGDYLATTEFRQTMFVELLSFIMTTAVIGALSAAVADYLQNRRVRPLRIYATQRIDDTIHDALDAVVLAIRDALGTPWYGEPRHVATPGYSAPFPRRETPGTASMNYRRFDRAAILLNRLLDRFAGVFDVEQQDDLARIEAEIAALRERICVIPYALEMGVPFRWSTRERNISAHYETLLRHLESLTAGRIETSRSIALINEWREVLDRDEIGAIGTMHRCFPENDSFSHAARSKGVAVEFDAPISDIADGIAARIPAEEIGVVGEGKFRIDEVEARIGAERLQSLLAKYAPQDPAPEQS